MDKGWIKIHRSIWDKGWSKRPEYVAVWVYLLKEATHEKREVFWNGKTVFIGKGQLITGRLKIAENTGVHESTVERILKTFENEQQIEQQKTSTSRLISILNYSKYQEGEQPFEQPLNNERTTDEQRLNTKQELKNDKELKKERVQKKIEPVTPLQKYIFSKHPNVSSLKDQLTEQESESLTSTHSKELIKEILQAMENKPDLKKKYKSVYLTVLNWIKIRNLKNPQHNDPQPKKADYSEQDDYYETLRRIQTTPASD